MFPNNNKTQQDLVDALKASAEEAKKLRESNEALAKATEEAAARTREDRAYKSKFLAAEKVRSQRFGGPGFGTDRLMKFSGADKIAGAVASGPAGLAAAGYLALAAGLGKTAQAMELVNNSAKTAAQKTEALFAQFVPGGQALLAFRDALNGTAEAIRKTERRFAENSLLSNQQFEAFGKYTASGAEAWKAGRDATSLGGLSAVQVGRHDRGTFQGELDYERDARLSPLRGAANRAEALAGAARQTEADSRGRMAFLDKERLNLQGGLDAAKGRQAAAVAKENTISEEAAKKNRDTLKWGLMKMTIPGPGGPLAALEMAGKLGWSALNTRNKAERNETGRDVEWSANAVEKLGVEHDQERLRLKEAQVNVAQRESEARKAGIAIQREELALLQEKGRRLEGNAQRLGGMNKAERMQGLAAARLVKERGIGDVAPMIRDAAERFAPDFIRKEKERFGETTEEGLAARAEGLHERGNIRENREAESKVRAEVAVNVILDEAAMGKAIAAALNETLGPLVKQIKSTQSAEVDKFKQGLQRGNNGSTQ